MHPRISTKNTPFNRCKKSPITRKALASIHDGYDGGKLMVMLCGCCRTPKEEEREETKINKPVFW